MKSFASNLQVIVKLQLGFDHKIYMKVKMDSSGDLKYWYRHISKGGWPFSTPDNGWIVSDCTSEGLKVITLEKRFPSQK